MAKILKKLSWYANRLRSMSLGEIGYRAQTEVGILRERTSVKRINYSSDLVSQSTFSRYKQIGIDNFFFCAKDADKMARMREVIADQFAEGTQATLELAEALLNRELMLFGRKVNIEEPVQWSRDPITGNVWPQTFWADIDTRDGETIGGIKWARELNRCLHFVTLGKAYWLTGDERFSTELCAQFESWMVANPPYVGIAWTASLSNAIRVINWIWALAFVYDAPQMTETLFGRIVSAIQIQTEFISQHLSKFSSANNHLIGEAAGLAFVALSLPWLTDADRYQETGLRILTQELEKQIYPDGVPAEQAINYLAFDLDFYLLIWRLSQVHDLSLNPIWAERLGASCTFLSQLMDEQGNVPAIGDSDDADVLRIDERHDADNFRSILATVAAILSRSDLKAKAGEWDEKSLWLLGEDGYKLYEGLPANAPPPTSLAFKDGGYYVMQTNRRKLIFDCGPLGYLSLAAHGHADALSLLLTAGTQPILIDPGTYAYREGGAWRRFFRSTAAHNTVVVNGQDQSEMLGDFLWGKRATARLITWRTTAEYDLVVAEHDGYTGFGVIHRRTILFGKPDSILVVDALIGEGDHQFEQNWHFSAETTLKQMRNHFKVTTGMESVQMLFESSLDLKTTICRGTEKPIQGWVSHYYGHKEAAPVISVSGNHQFPVTLTTLVHMGPTMADKVLYEKKVMLEQFLASLV